MASPIEPASTELPAHDFYRRSCDVDSMQCTSPSDSWHGDNIDNDKSSLVPRPVRRRASVRRYGRLQKCAQCCACVIGFPTIGVLICMVSYMGGSRNWLLLAMMGAVLPPYTYYVENCGLLAMLVRPFDAHAAASHARAEAYYQRQRPIFEAAAKRWSLHPYFVEQGRAPEFNRLGSTLYDTLTARLRVMGALLRSKGWDDFRIEKDKCEMYKFLTRNRLPMVPVFGYYYEQQQFLTAVRSGSAFANTTRWPVYIKFCHLTQGSALSVRRIQSYESLVAHSDEIALWIDRKWNQRADDITRPWRAYSNFLTDSVMAGALLQAAANLTFNPLTQAWAVVEMKVEVVWGRAYLAALLPDDTLSEFPVVTRGMGDDDGEIEVFDSYFAAITYRGRPLSPNAWYRWILEPGYLSCVWRLAERAAAIMRADQVRIDVFLTQHSPDGCSINEDSLSSGQKYGPHGYFLNQLWLEAWVNRWYHESPPTEQHTPVYMEMEVAT